jgi:membrane protein YqaA with SNARE-associated domain
VAGALVGGSLLYGFAAWQPAHAAQAVDAVPGITHHVWQEAQTNYDQTGLLAILYGPLKTIPYKVYTILAPPNDVSYLQFIAISVPARMLRFVLLTALVAAVSNLLSKFASLRSRYLIFACCWITAYILYFAHHWI